MTHLKYLGDQRMSNICAYCSGENESRDHVPSKILLEEPFPINLPLVPCCLECNTGFSADEEYFACLIECVISGSTDPENLSREKIKRILVKKPNIRNLLTQSMVTDENGVAFSFQLKRVKNVLRKLATGHLKYETGDTPLNEPTSITFAPIHLFSEDQKNQFFQSQRTLLPEVGSRGLERILLSDLKGSSHWIEIQENIYSYSITDSSVRILIWNYLACEIIWD